jgi:hypothetical protein
LPMFETFKVYTVLMEIQPLPEVLNMFNYPHMVAITLLKAKLECFLLLDCSTK